MEFTNIIWRRNLIFYCFVYLVFSMHKPQFNWCLWPSLLLSLSVSIHIYHDCRMFHMLPACHWRCEKSFGTMSSLEFFYLLATQDLSNSKKNSSSKSFTNFTLMLFWIKYTRRQNQKTFILQANSLAHNFCMDV